MRSIKEEFIERMIFFGEKTLQNAVVDFLAHYHQDRNHQGLNNRLIKAEAMKWAVLPVMWRAANDWVGCYGIYGIIIDKPPDLPISSDCMQRAATCG
jgi:hypothetical protein